MPTASDDFYEILQIHYKAEPEVVRAAYQRLVQKYHPDKNPDYTAQMDECMKKISQAYAVLKDPDRRADYDRKAGYAGKGSGGGAASGPAGGGSKADDTPKKDSATRPGGTDKAGGGPKNDGAAKASQPGGASGASQPGVGAAARTRTADAGRQEGAAGKSGAGRQAGWITEKSGYGKSGRHGGYGTRRKPPAKSADASGTPDIHGWDAERVQARQRATAERLRLPTFFRRRLAGGGEGPVMAVIPPGSFLMGSPGGFLGFGGEKEREAGEGPQHRVAFAQPFAIGRFAVTFAEYDPFCEATGRQKPGDEGWGRGRRPVVNVDWHDARAYCRWLSKQTGKNYHLPSEAEWEYACRAGSATAFWWSGDITPVAANYNGQYAYNRGDKGRFRGKTLPVDEFRPNPFGLYQTSGNVWEWCEDDWHKNYKNAPADGGPWIDAERGGSRVVRGGSWVSVPGWLRSAYRTAGEAVGRYDNQGFRVAETLVP